MGSFYGSIHIRSTQTEQITEIVKKLAAQEKLKFLISPCINGWISVYSSEKGQNPIVVSVLAKQFSGHLLNLILYHDDFFYYEYYRKHQLMDTYSSSPEYFGTISREEKLRLTGKPEVFTDLLAELPNNQTTIEHISELLKIPFLKDGEELSPRSLELLQRLQNLSKYPDMRELIDDKSFAAAIQFSSFAQLLNISNAATCYEYLQDGEDENIERREEFIHVPDLSIELAHKEREKAKIDEVFTQLNRSGLLLLTISRPTPKGQFLQEPISVPDPMDGFFIGWCGLWNQPLEIKHYTAPWNNEPKNIELPLEQNAYVMQVSPSGKFLTVGHVSESLQAAVFDLEKKQLLKMIPLSRATDIVQLSANEEILISRLRDEIILSSIKNSQDIAAIKVGHGSKIAIHPNGRYLVADERESKLAIVDLNTQKVIKVLSTAALDKKAWRASVERGEGVNAFHDSDIIVKMDFSPDGRWLFCAMAQGVRVFEWNEIFSSKTKLPLPVVASSSEVVTFGDPPNRMARTYDIAFDWQRNVLLSCGLEGKVKSLNLATGESKVLLELPGKLAVIQLKLSRDLATLCTHSMADMFERRQGSCIVQLWNYLALV